MAHSKKTSKHSRSRSTHHSSAEHAIHRKPSRNASIIVGVFMALLGLAVGFFAGGTTLSTVAGAVIGGVAGYFAGLSIDKNAEVKTK